MFEGWDNFYLLIGGAAGSLIGLLFIVATLFSGRDRTRMLRAAAVYTTPTVFNLSVVLVLSAMALAPGLKSGFVGAALAAAGLIGLAHGVTVIWRFRWLNANEKPHWSDAWCYCAGPVAAHVGLLSCAALAWFDAHAAPLALAVVLMIMLLLAIRNAWDLVTWMAPVRGAGEELSTTPPADYPAS
ncbi:MAG TPA: hypothetical protein VMU59_15565 [Caulobacteraceae bacterium]|nr:hypothetical protein [Caulobacteraceae bacterium]